jgi:predicted Holliday junction resolvase-like endonuclease
MFSWTIFWCTCAILMLPLAVYIEYSRRVMQNQLDADTQSLRNSVAAALQTASTYEERARQVSLELHIAEQKLLHVTAANAAELKDLANNHAINLKEARKHAISQSKAVHKGNAFENLTPFMIKDISPGDFRHMGDPIDFVVFRGYEDLRGNRATEVEEVMLLDVKTGKSTLSTPQRRIRDAVVAGRISFGIYNPDTNKLRRWRVELQTKEVS